MKETKQERQARLAKALRENLLKRKSQQRGRRDNQAEGVIMQKNAEAVTAAILVIGDEILSGRTKDTNINFIATKCTEIGIDLKEVRVIPDHEQMIIESVNGLRSRYSYLFTTGGIGGTHDDITAQSIAKAFNVPFVVNEEAMNIIETYYGDRINNTRRLMGRMPLGSILVPNPVSSVPSFQIENVFALAGMPRVMEGMFEAIMGRLAKGVPMMTNTLTSNIVEGILGEALATIQEKYPDVSIGSYPFYNYPDIGTSLVLRGRNIESLRQATQNVYQMLKDFSGNIKTDLQVDI